MNSIRLTLSNDDAYDLVMSLASGALDDVADHRSSPAGGLGTPAHIAQTCSRHATSISTPRQTALLRAERMAQDKRRCGLARRRGRPIHAERRPLRRSERSADLHHGPRRQCGLEHEQVDVRARRLFAVEVETIRFEGEIRYWKPERASGLAVVDIPASFVEALGGLKQQRARGKIVEAAFASNVMPAGGGRLALSVSRAMMSAAGVGVGDTAWFEITEVGRG
jgi:hypothetical protein